MSIAEIDRFAADMKSNEALRAEAVKARVDTSHATPIDRAVAFAASKGYAFTADEAKEYAKARQLTDAELDGVAGGAGISMDFGVIKIFIPPPPVPGVTEIGGTPPPATPANPIIKF